MIVTKVLKHHLNLQEREEILRALPQQRRYKKKQQTSHKTSYQTLSIDLKKEITLLYNKIMNELCDQYHEVHTNMIGMFTMWLKGKLENLYNSKY